MVARSTIIATLKQTKKQQNINWDGPTPLYHQLYSLLKQQIIDGTITYGSHLPTEQELGEAFGLSRITVKRAMDELSAENLVERRRGRGTTVTYKYKPKPVKAPLVGMLENIETMSRHTRTKKLDIAQAIPPADIRGELKLSSTDTACKLIRVRLTEDEKIPFAYYLSWTLTSVDTFSDPALKDHTRIELLRQQGINLSRIDQLISAEPANAEVAKELKLREGSPILVLARRSYDEKGNLVDILFCKYNPAIFQYQMTMELGDNKNEK
ncbi:GntR family transcriptional regulator [Alteromonas sp. C1M14]|uniref:GntR family transcriptional regulator n=1 Tax=Alteromonas sp. C1M14 TaxID=2841567 RepID=UPI001C0975FC|nr:GntR family transcriptional regulator [Alteromonas sp. C1M14]MBU2980020.1 GntR family transcriptional regulator [Alteromonas sp. C1M14]